MALGTRHTRRITVDGERYVWRCAFGNPAERHSRAFTRGAHEFRDDLIIRPETGAHRLLVVHWPICSGVLVTPGVVRACIVEAIERGWPADQPALELSGSDFAATS